MSELKETTQNQNIVEVKSGKSFPYARASSTCSLNHVKAVDDVSFAVRKGETLGMVGKSAFGKTTIGRSMLRLVEPTFGSIQYEGRDMLPMHGKELKDVRRHMQIIFQDPYASLDPRVPIGESVMEGLHIHNIGTRKERFDLMIDTLKELGSGRLSCPSLPA